MFKKWFAVLCFLSLNLGMMTALQAATIDVNCNNSPPGSLTTAVSSAIPGSIINVTGICHDAIIINKDDITLVGNLSGNKATITGFFPEDRVTIDGAARVNISGFKVENAVLGIVATNNASFNLSEMEVTESILGIDVTGGSTATFSGINSISGSRTFGLEALTGSKLIFAEDSLCQIFNNTLGAQVSVNSSLFANTGAKIVSNNNHTIGFSINTGSTGMLFNATMHTHNNGLDGFDVVSAANFEVDGESELISENNGRDGISVDNSTLNMFGFFSTVPGFPRVTSSGNAGNGILVESTSKLDVGRNSSIVVMGNGAAGINLDDGSSAVIQRSDIQNNHGELVQAKSHNDDDGDNRKPADVVVTFGSRISFLQNPDNAGEIIANQVGLALCDRTSLSRGDVRCKR